MSGPETRGPETREPERLDPWACVLCHRELRGVVHKRCVVVTVSGRGVDDAYPDEHACFCLPCSGLLRAAVDNLRAAAGAGEKRPR